MPIINSNDTLIEKIKKNYLSIVLGVLVIMVVVSLVTKKENGKNQSNNNQGSILSKILKTVNPKTEEISENKEITVSYTVKKGDHLWRMAEGKYGSGYNWVDIAKANNLKQPSSIEVGQKLIIPDVAAKLPTTGTIAKAQTAKITITSNSYTVKKGDCLWKIAEMAYGDGFQWSRIAKANNINNPGYIEINQKLKLPR